MVALFCLTWGGCGGRQETPLPASESQPRSQSVTLTVLVMNNQSLADALAALRGEWQERSDGGDFLVKSIDRGELESIDLDADLVIFPARLLGELVEAGQLRPVRKRLLDDPSLNLADLLPRVRTHEIVYAREVMALPIATATPLIVSRSGISLSEDFHSSSSSAVVTGGEPLAGHFAALSFLARGIRYAKQPRSEGVLFDPDTMDPRITGPAWVRALAEMAAAHQETSATDSLTPELLASQLLDHQVDWASCWPTLAANVPASIDLRSFSVRPYPAANEFYSLDTESWTRRQRPRPVVLLGGSGALLGVTQKTRNATPAFDLMQWLAGPQVSPLLAQSRHGLAPGRRSLLATGGNWLTSEQGPLAEEIGRALAASMGEEEVVLVPRIPGVEEYLATLAGEVRQVLERKKAPTDGLTDAATGWQAITDRLGREQQQAAYLRSLNRRPLAK